MARPFSIVYTVVDDSGDEAETAIYVPDSFSLAQYTEFGAGFATLFDAILHGRVSQAGLNVDIDISSLTSNVVADDSNVEEIAAFQFLTSENRQVDLNVPAMIESAELEGTDELDTSDPAVSAIITAMEDGIVTAGGTITPTDIGEDDITATSLTRSEHRNSGRS